MDLCHPALHPRIHCDKVSADGYDVTNLVSADLRVRARGFRAEYFIKPPVNVILSFPFHVHIHRIDVDPCVGSNVSLGLQILTHSAASVENWLVDSKQSSTSASLNSALNPDTFNLIGKAFLEERRFLCFKNNRYSQRHPFVGKDFLPGALECNVYETNLWQKSLASLNRVSHLMVRIVRTQSASIPVLRSVQVYGQPSASCDKEVISLVYQIFKSLKQPPPVESAATSVQSPPCKEEEVQDVSRNVQQESSKDNPSIPLEFLDEITLEMMALPMMLPSGHSVDQSTLDKHSQSEEVWGRPPSDPFTGVPYKRNSYPIPNATLKVRIDKFLLQEGKHLTNVGRTVGRRTRSAAQASATTNQNVSPSGTSIQQAPSTSNAVHLTAQQVSQGLTNMSKSASISSNHAPKASDLHVNTSLCAQEPSRQSGNLAKRCTEGSELSEPCRKRPKVTGEQPYSGSHEEALSQSLDAALARTLGSIPTFKRRKEPAISQVAASSLVEEDNNKVHANKGIHGNTTSTAAPGGSSCCRCNSPAARNSCNLLQLPCLHLMCRRCLVQVQQERTLICALCQKDFQTGDVVTVHL